MTYYLIDERRYTTLTAGGQIPPPAHYWYQEYFLATGCPYTTDGLNSNEAWFLDENTSAYPSSVLDGVMNADDHGGNEGWKEWKLC